MSKDIEEPEFKRISYVWILNLIPPGSGIGTVYGCGNLSFILVLLCWFYIACHFNLEAILDVYLVLSTFGTIGCLFHNLSQKSISRIAQEYEDKIYPEPLEIFLAEEVLETPKIKHASPEELPERTSYFEKCSVPENEDSDKYLDSPHTILQDTENEKLLQSVSKDSILMSESSNSISSCRVNDMAIVGKIDHGLRVSEDEKDREISSIEKSSRDLEMEESSHLKEELKSKLNKPLLKKIHPVSEQFSSNEEFISSGNSQDKVEIKDESSELVDHSTDLKEEQKLIEQRLRLLKKMGEATGEFQVETHNFDSFESAETGISVGAFDFQLPTSFESNYAYLSLTVEKNDMEDKKNSLRCKCGSEVNPSFSFCLTCGYDFG